MSKRKTDVIENFGERLAQSARPPTTRSLSSPPRGTSRRACVAYYEAPNAQPPAHLLPQMAQALGAGADVLLGMTQPRKVKRLAANAVCSFRSVANRLAVRVAEPGVCVIFQFLQGADPS